jgi:predicted lipoprotein with Yx(FWY)xxD motif
MNPLDDRTMLHDPMIRLLGIAAITATLALAACGGDDAVTSGGTGTPTAADGDAGAAGDTATRQENGTGAEAKGNAGGGTEIQAADSQYGSVLFDGSDQAIYFFDKETSPRPACYGACAEAWPPVLTKGEPVAGDGVDSSLLGTTARDDGSMQVTYNGRPLYFYVDDPPGKVLCHNVEEFGGLWLAVEPDGEAVQ